MKKFLYTITVLLASIGLGFGQGGPISGFTPLTDAAPNDEMAIVDKSATPPATGTTKKITVQNLLKLLHGDLDVGGNEIISSSNGNITLSPNGVGTVVLDGITYPKLAEDGPAGSWMITDGAANLSFSNDLVGVSRINLSDPGVLETEIVSGEIAPDRSIAVVTPEAATGDSDNLDSISYAGMTAGDILVLQVASGKDVTLRDGVGNLDLGSNVLLNSTNETWSLIYNGTNWITFAHSPNTLSVEVTESHSFPVIEPDAVLGVNDDVILMHFPSGTYPNGVTITSIKIAVPDGYTSELFTFEEWDDAVGTTQTTVEAITVSGTTGADNGVDDGAMATNSYLVWNGDDTPEAVSQALITVEFTVN